MAARLGEIKLGRRRDFNAASPKFGRIPARAETFPQTVRFRMERVGRANKELHHDIHESSNALGGGRLRRSAHRFNRIGARLRTL
jgi:hypothetical protein